MSEQATIERQRVDKWLWFSRIVKTRTLAGELITTGKLRVNSTKISKPSHMVKPGDVLTFTHYSQVKIIKIVGIGSRRGPAPEAQALYEDMSPPVVRPDPLSRPAEDGKRESGAGRPTKKDRRDIERWMQS